MAFQYGLDLKLNEQIDEDIVLFLSDDQAGRLLGCRGANIKDMRALYPHLKIEVSDRSCKKRYVKICGQKKVSAYGKILGSLR